MSNDNKIAGTYQVSPAAGYTGDVAPATAWKILSERKDAVLIDVRTRAEWNYVGRIPDSVLVEWNTYPAGEKNPQFLDQLQSQVEKTDAPVMFLCRSGARSHAAAAAATGAGYPNSFNILEGFEGDKDAQGHRNSVGGWRVAGLPWVQG